MKILVIAEHKNGALSEATRELFGLPFGQAEVHAVAAGEGVEPLAASLGQLGAAKVHLIDSPVLADGTGESLDQAIGQFIEQLAPDAVVVAHTPLGKDLAPRLAAALDAALATDCIQVNLDGGEVTVRRPVYAGKATAEVEFTDD
ncbi:MAG TPA: electron transfer flavoprotein subunit alpha/FixB family protein, partial [Verrucomicrobiota bacterium]|nr:electron transfer flavoprotein subunit alpha/FixB family protein [Verrucomicrobiota bacterium]